MIELGNQRITQCLNPSVREARFYAIFKLRFFEEIESAARSAFRVNKRNLGKQIP